MHINLSDLNNKNLTELRAFFLKIPLTETVLVISGKFDSSTDSKIPASALNYLPKHITTVEFIAEYKEKNKFSYIIQGPIELRSYEGKNTDVGDLLKEYVVSLPETVEKISLSPRYSNNDSDTIYMVMDEFNKVVCSIPETIRELNLLGSVPDIEAYRAAHIVNNLPKSIHTVSMNVPWVAPNNRHALANITNSLKNSSVTKFSLHGGSHTLVDENTLDMRIIQNLPSDLFELNLNKNDLINLPLLDWKRLLTALPKKLGKLGLGQVFWGSQNGLSIDGLKIVLSEIPHSVHYLDLGENALLFGTPDNLSSILLNLPETVNKLRLVEENVWPESAYQLAQRLSVLPNHIQTYSLKGNNLFGLSVKDFITAIAGLPNTVHTLDLSDTMLNNRFGGELSALFKGLPPQIKKIILQHNQLASISLTTLKMAFRSIPGTVIEIDLSENGFDRIPLTRFNQFIEILPVNGTRIILDENRFMLRNDGSLAPYYPTQHQDFFKPVQGLWHQKQFAACYLPMMQLIKEGRLNFDVMEHILSFILQESPNSYQRTINQLGKVIIPSKPPTGITPAVQSETLDVVTQRLQAVNTDSRRLDLSRCGLSRLDDIRSFKTIFSMIPKSVTDISFRGNGFQHSKKALNMFIKAMGEFPEAVSHLDLSDNHFEHYDYNQLKQFIERLPSSIKLISFTSEKPLSPANHLINCSWQSTYASWSSHTTDFVGKSRLLLNDYTKDDSAFWRFFTGHWNRHHTTEVARVVCQIDHDVLKNETDIISECQHIPLSNVVGSLATRLSFLARESTKPKALIQPGGDNHTESKHAPELNDNIELLDITVS